MVASCAAITAAANPAEVASATVAAMASLLPGAHLAVAELRGSVLRVVAAQPELPADVLESPVGEGRVGRAAAASTTTYSPDLRSDRRVQRRPTWPPFADARSLLAVPLVSTDGVLGVMVAMSTQPDAFTAADAARLV